MLRYRKKTRKTIVVLIYFGEEWIRIFGLFKTNTETNRTVEEEQNHEAKDWALELTAAKTNEKIVTKRLALATL